ncbi:hypothetical protein ACI8AG_20210 [Blastococcus sp. SYSU DS0552]
MTETSRTGDRPTAATALPDDATREVRERARHELRVHALVGAPYAAGTTLLLLEPASWTAGTWWAAGAFATTAALLAWAFLGTERGREGHARRLLAGYAVAHHVDPGPGRREAADLEARNMARQRPWGLLIVALVLTPPLLFGEWDDPATAVPGAALLAVAGAVSVVDRLRQAAAGRRWLAGPPGPPRT